MNREDVLYIPMYYRTPWSVYQNKLLAGMFSSLPVGNEQTDYWKARKMYFAAIYTHLPEMKRAKALLFSDLTKDFIQDALYLPRKPKIYGIVRAINQFENKKNSRLASYELEMAKLCEKVLCPSQLLADTLPGASTVVTGSPIYSRKEPPRVQGTIIWNHRSASNKGWSSLPKLPEHILNRIILSIPNPVPSDARKILSPLPFLRTHIGAYEDQYKKAFSESGYVLHTGEMDSFCYSVVEAVWAGMFALARRNNGFSRYLPDEMIYEDFSELDRKITYYDNHPDERKRLVEQAQSNLETFQPDKWLERVAKAVGVEW